MKRFWTISMLIVVALLAATRPSPVAAQEEQPQAAPPELDFFTTFPSQVVGADDVINLDVTLRSDISQVVQLEAREIPEGWTVTFRGSGHQVKSVYLEAGDDVSLDVRIEVPADAQADTYRVLAVARGEEGQAELPLEFTVEARRPTNISLDASPKNVSGAPDTVFRYDATLENESNEELTVNLSAEAPAGFRTAFEMGGEEITGLSLGPNQSRNIAVKVVPPANVQAGTYPITVRAQGGDTEATLDLEAEITGQPELALTTPDGRLSLQAQAGRETPLKILVRNTGSAPVTQVELRSSAPSGWTVEFEPQEIAEIPAGGQVEAVARLRPAEKAVAGDYQVSLRASSDEGESTSEDFRITVVTSTLWGVVGIGLIAVAVGVVAIAVLRFGRR
jgi:uncharacterized membrane protein